MLENLPSPVLAFLQFAFVFALSPLLIGIMRKVKARFQGRCGSPVIQPYIDIIKLLSKGSARSSITPFIFAIAPVAGFASIAIASLMLPILSPAPVLAANIIVFIYLFAIGRFLTALSGLDAGSAFGGMGSSREMLYSILIEPAMFAIVIIMATSGSLNIVPLAPDLASWQLLITSPVYWLIAAALLLAIMAETGRLPFDNPATHLELTMVHEAMILENSGPSLALVEWAHAAKIFLFFSFVAILLAPGSLQANPLWPLILFASTVILAVIVATIESISVKVRLFKVSELLIFATLLGLMAFLMRIFVVKSDGESWLQAIMALAMLLAAIYFLFSNTIRNRIQLYIVQSICLVAILLQVSLTHGAAGMNYLFIAAIAALKILIIPFVLYHSLSFGMKLMPLNFYLRFGEAREKFKLNLDADPIFMNAPMTTSRALIYASIIMVLAFAISSVLGGTTIILPLTVALILIGMLIIASKTHLILQLLGFLMMENGVVLLPYALHINLPFIGELVALFDVIILVRITLLLSFKMKETHGTLDTEKLVELVEKR
ncbi:MAG: NADH-quinone oxidoreductase subunit H [Candidatus Micrarchaeota archaeon]|nr:NADH-quinone oxidoreductase subunit H [Candidatus Micrarchaeota archaeon]